MAAIPGVNIASSIVPYDSNESHATHQAKYGKGGWRTCSTKAERNAISVQRCEIGMVAITLDDGKAWQLQDIHEPLTDADWSEYQPGKTWNLAEPHSSIENPNPQHANYFESDDYIYKQINGIWKRWAFSEFYP